MSTEHLTIRNGTSRPRRHARRVPCLLLLVTALPVACSAGSGDPRFDDVGSDEVSAADEASGEGNDGGEDDGDVADRADARPPCEAGTDVPPGLLCGNGVVDPGEACDDGNLLNGDECDWQCRSGAGDPPEDLPPDPSVDRLEVEPGFVWPELGDAVENGPCPDPEALPLVWTGSEYAALWVEFDSDAGSSHGHFFRFDATGLVLGEQRTVFSNPGFPAEGGVWPYADLVWTGSEFGILGSGDSGSAPDGTPTTELFQALDAAGEPLTDVVQLTPWGQPSEVIGLAYDGEGYGVLTGGGLFVTEPVLFDRIGLRGEPRGCGPMELSVESARGVSTLAWSGTAYVAAWIGPGPFPDTAARFNVIFPDGTRPPRSIGLGPVQAWSDGGVGVAWSGESFGLVWVGIDPATDDDALFLLRLDASGRPLGPPRAVVDLSADDTVRAMAMTYGSGTFAIAWFRAYGVLSVARFDRNGTFVERLDFDPLSGAAGYWVGNEGFGIVADPGGFAVLATAIRWGLYQPLFVRLRLVP